MKLLKPLLSMICCMLAFAACTPTEPETPGNGVSDVPTGPSQEEKHGISYLYDGSVLPEIHIEVKVEEWNTLLAAFDANNHTKKQVHCDVQYVKGDEVSVVKNAGIRLKGNTSRVRPEGSSGQKHNATKTNWHHCHYQVNFHKYEKDDEHKVHGAQKIVLKWFKEDPSYAREPYCYDLFRRFGVWTAAHNDYCKVYIRIAGDAKEAYLGIYDMIEPIDDDFLKVRKEEFGSSKGYLWKCRYGARLNSTNADFGADEDTDAEHTYELKTNVEEFTAAEALFKDFISKLNSLKGDEFEDWIESVCDVELLLRTYAVNVAVGMWDDYWNNCNNYYVYFSGKDASDYKFWFIPYDYDNTLGTCTGCGVQDDAGRHNPFEWGNSSSQPLIGKILKIERFRKMYSDALLELADGSKGYIDPVASARRIRDWQDRVREFVPNDTGEDMTIADRPASWGNHGEYRITDTGSASNYFRIKKQSIKQYCQ